MAIQEDPISATLQNGLSELRLERLATLEESVSVYLAMQSLLLNEAQRITNKLGANDNRSKEITNRLQTNIATCHQLQVEWQLARIELPQVAKDSALIYGRVIDQDGLGIDRLIAYLANPSGARLDINQSETDVSGFFAIALDSATLLRINQASPESVILAIATPKGRLLYQRPNLNLTQGGRLAVEIPLNRTDLIALK